MNYALLSSVIAVLFNLVFVTKFNVELKCLPNHEHQSNDKDSVFLDF